LTHQLAPKRARCEIGAVALPGEENQSADAVEDFRYHPVGGVGAVLCYVCADFVDVVERFRVERVGLYIDDMRQSGLSWLVAGWGAAGTNG
jgi:hypothetical protein